MEKSKCIKTLSALAKEEISRFKTFVSSPYFNNNQELTALLDILVSENIIQSQREDSQLIMKKLRPGQPYNERKLTDLLYKPGNLLESFLSAESYKSKPFQQKINVLSMAYAREIEPVIYGIEKDLNLLHENNPVRDSNYYFEKFLVHSEQDTSFRLSGKIRGNDSLQAKADTLDIFYMALKLKDACEMLNRSRIVSATYNLKTTDYLVNYIRQNPEDYKDIPAIQVYYNMYLMLTDTAHGQYYFELKRLAETHPGAFIADELRSIYGYIQNYCIRRLNQGDAVYLHYLFDIYKDMYTNGLVLGDNKNMQWDFKNYVSLGLRLKEYDWTLEMINAFKPHLPENIRQNAYTYNLANYYYETGEYSKAVKLLHAVEFTDIYYNLDAKVMLLKTYYRNEEEESFYALVSAFSNYLRRNTLISEANAELYRNLVKFSKKAFNLKTKLPYQRKKEFYKKLETLKSDISANKTANSNWLLAELENIS